MIIDASNQILGRMASAAAVAAAKGEEVIIVNCENAVITGKKSMILQKYLKRAELGQPQQGPFFGKRPDTLVRRTIRGMVAWKKTKGKVAYKNVKCYIDFPEEIPKDKLTEIKGATLKPGTYHMKVKELCRLIGK